MDLFFATTNQGKVDDVQAVLADTGMTVKQLDVELIEPQEATLADIVRFKVEQAAEQAAVDGYIMADDSGLFVDELDGFPGILSSPFDGQVGMEKLLRLVDSEQPPAAFHAAIALQTPDEEIKIFTGSCSGTLVAPRGSQGFGYDPIFLPAGHDQTFAEDVAYKRQVSHRKEALDKLHDWLQDQQS